MDNHKLIAKTREEFEKTNLANVGDDMVPQVMTQLCTYS